MFQIAGINRENPTALSPSLERLSRWHSLLQAGASALHLYGSECGRRRGDWCAGLAGC